MSLCYGEREEDGENGETCEVGREAREAQGEESAARELHGDDIEEKVGDGGGEWTHCSSSREKDKVTGRTRTVQGEKMTENHRRFIWSDSVLNCPLVPGGTRPSRSHPWFLSLPCSTAGSRSRWCRPLPARCGTAGSGRSGPCSWETLRGITEPAWGKISMAKNDQLSRDSSIITDARRHSDNMQTTHRKILGESNSQPGLQCQALF